MNEVLGDADSTPGSYLTYPLEKVHERITVNRLTEKTGRSLLDVKRFGLLRRLSGNNNDGQLTGSTLNVVQQSQTIHLSHLDVSNDARAFFQTARFEKLLR